jgi:D-glycero-D-manno-heptose 1,7-bisphosphate phosphatase
MPAPLRAAAFLDRDGVINSYVYNAEFGTVDSPSHPDQFELMPGAAEAIRLLKRLGLLVIVVSNQPGIAKRKFNAELLRAMTRKMRLEIEAAGGGLDGVYYCLHHPQATVGEFRGECACRKPKPGLLLAAARDFAIDCGRSYMIGDGITDIAAGARAGTKTILVSSRKCYLCEALEHRDLRPDFVAESLAGGVGLIQAIEQDSHSAAEFACQPESLATGGPLAPPYACFPIPPHANHEDPTDHSFAYGFEKS